MYKRILFVALFMCSVYAGICQSKTSQTDTINSKAQKAPAEYFDEQGNKVSEEQFEALLTDVQYTIEQKEGSNSLKLIKSGIKYKVGGAAPDFMVKDMKGKAYSLKDLKGKTVVLNFWFISCINCMKELPDLNKLVEKYKNDKDVVFLAITFETKQKIQKYLTKHNFRYNIVPDQMSVLKEYGVSVCPVSVVIDPKGIVVYSPSTNLKIDIFQKLDEAIKKAAQNKS